MFFVIDKYIVFAVNAWGKIEINHTDGSQSKALKPINYFFRGVSNLIWDLKPSALRDQENYAKVEEKYK